jgi:hypothetical protein
MGPCGEWSPSVWLERNENMALLSVDLLAHSDIVEYLGYSDGALAAGSKKCKASRNLDDPLPESVHLVGRQVANR